MPLESWLGHPSFLLPRAQSLQSSDMLQSNPREVARTLHGCQCTAGSSRIQSQSTLCLSGCFLALKQIIRTPKHQALTSEDLC